MAALAYLQGERKREIQASRAVRVKTAEDAKRLEQDDRKLGDTKSG